MFTGRPTQGQAITATHQTQGLFFGILAGDKAVTRNLSGKAEFQEPRKMALATPPPSVQVTPALEKENESPSGTKSEDSANLMARRTTTNEKVLEQSTIDNSSPRKLRIVNLNEQSADGTNDPRPIPLRSTSARSNVSATSATSTNSQSSKYPQRQPAQASAVTDSAIVAVTAAPPTAKGASAASTSARDTLLRVVNNNEASMSRSSSRGSIQDDLLAAMGIAVRRSLPTPPMQVEPPPKRGLVEAVLDQAYRASSGRAVFGAYRLGKTLGEGQFGKVKHAIRYLPYAQDLQAVRDSGRYVSPWAKPGAGLGDEAAIKLIKKSFIFKRARTQAQIDSQLQSIKREIGALKAVCHPNIVKIQEVIETENYIGIALEYSPTGDLLNVLNRYGRPYEAKAQLWGAQLCSAVSYMHDCGLVHRDLKPENILLDRKQNILVSDLGFANFYDTESARQDLMLTACGSPLYASPELFLSRAGYHGRAADVWSCGVIIFVITSLNHPWPDAPEEIHQLYDYIMVEPLEFTENITTICRDLLSGMMDTDHRTRSTMFEVLDHPWFEDYQDFTSMTRAELEHSAILQARRDLERRTTKYSELLQASKTGQHDHTPPRSDRQEPQVSPELVAAADRETVTKQKQSQADIPAADMKAQLPMSPVSPQLPVFSGEAQASLRWDATDQAPMPPPKDWTPSQLKPEIDASEVKTTPEPQLNTSYPSPDSTPELPAKPLHQDDALSNLSSDTLQEVVETAITNRNAPSPTIDAVVHGFTGSPFYQPFGPVDMTRSRTSGSAFDELCTLPGSTEGPSDAVSSGSHGNNLARSDSGESHYETIERPSTRIGKGKEPVYEDAPEHQPFAPTTISPPQTPHQTADSRSAFVDDLAPTPPPKPTTKKANLTPARDIGDRQKGQIPKSGSPQKLALERARNAIDRTWKRQSAPPGAYHDPLSKSMLPKGKIPARTMSVKKGERHHRGLSIDSVRRIVQPSQAPSERHPPIRSISEKVENEREDKGVSRSNSRLSMLRRSKTGSIAKIADLIKYKSKEDPSRSNEAVGLGIHNLPSDSLSDQEQRPADSAPESLDTSRPLAADSFAAIAKRKGSHIKRLSVNRLATFFNNQAEGEAPRPSVAERPSSRISILRHRFSDTIQPGYKSSRDPSPPPSKPESSSMHGGEPETLPRTTSKEAVMPGQKTSKRKPVLDWIKKRSPAFAAKLH